MMNSKQIAALVGPTVIVLTLSEALNFHIWATNLPPVTYLNGLMFFVAGLSIVRVHNKWRGWPVWVTIAGWLFIFFGLFRMFFPEARQASENIATYTVIFLLFAAGIFLTFKGYGRDGNKSTRN